MFLFKKKTPFNHIVDITLDMISHADRYMEPELIRQYIKVSDHNGLLRLAAEEYRRREEEKNRPALLEKENKLLTAKLVEAHQLAITAKKENRALIQEFETHKAKKEAIIAKQEDIIKNFTSEQKNKVKERQEIIMVLFNSSTTEARRSYGTGYNLEFKNYVWAQLGKIVPKFYSNESVCETAFVKLYNIINIYTEGKFYSEFKNYFVPTVKASGVKAPGAPTWDWNKLDMISSNKFWQAIAKMALADYQYFSFKGEVQ